MIKPLLAAAAVATALLSAAPAHADERDQVFLRALDTAGLVVVDVNAVIHDAYLVCDWAEYRSKGSIVKDIKDANPDLGLQLATRFVDLSVATYCPDQQLSYT